MDSKSSLNNLLSKQEKQQHLEKQLLPRLKCMGYIMMGFSALAILYAAIAPRESPDEISWEQSQQFSTGPTLFPDETPLALDPQEIFNFYMIGAIFALVGGALFLYTKQKTRKLCSTQRKKF